MTNMIQTMEEAIWSQVHESTNNAADKYRTSVRPIYGTDDGERPEIIGSALLIDIDGSKFVVTAAHIADWTRTHGLFVSGTVGTQPVQIDGDITMTVAPNQQRGLDKMDFAFWQVPRSAEINLGDVKFININDINDDRVLPKNRMYLGLGYPISKNKKGVNNISKTIKTSLWKYTAGVEELPELARELGVPNDKHFFLKFDKYSSTYSGEKVNSGSPRGVSGGALIDLGNFSSPSIFNSKNSGKLCGMIIEKNDKHKALIAVKMKVIIDAIKEQLPL